MATIAELVRKAEALDDAVGIWHEISSLDHLAEAKAWSAIRDLCGGSNETAAVQVSMRLTNRQR